MGVGLVGAFAAWITLVGQLTGGDPTPALALVGAGLATFGLVRAVSPRIPRLGPAAVLVAGALLPFVPVGGVVPTGQRFGPLEYANATALFYLLVAAAGGMLATMAQGRLGRFIGVLAALVAAAIVVVSGSEAATGLLLLLPVAAFARHPAGARRFLSCAAALVVAAIATTILLGTLHATPRGLETVEELASTALTERRLDLWRDALHIAAREPVTGVGPGEFRFHSPTALRDQDALAAHDEYLQAAAELGLPGLLLAIALTLWAFARLRRAVPETSASFAGAALAAVGIHSSVDYVLHAPAIILAVTALVAAGSAAVAKPPPLSRPEGGVPVTTAARTRARGSQD